MLRISWRPQVAILRISRTVRRIYLIITFARFARLGAKMLPRCSNFARVDGKGVIAAKALRINKQ
jgi:hypothetical protein